MRILILALCLGTAGCWANDNNGSYGGNPASQRFSPLRQINRANVKNLKLAWRFDAAEPGDAETNPLVVDGVLYAYTPSLKVVALDAVTGRELWRYDTGLPAGQPSRGLSFWSDGKFRRLFAGILNYLIALDPATGQPVFPVEELATPAIYMAKGKEYVVIETNNARNRGASQGSAYVAFCL